MRQSTKVADSIQSNQRGSIIYVFMMVAAIEASFLALYLHSANQSTPNEIVRQRLSQTLETKRSALLEALTNGFSWGFTLTGSAPDSSYGNTKNNLLLLCLNDPNYNCSVTPFNIAVVNSGNVTLDYVSSDAGTRGFDHTGTSCNNFGESSCPFRYTISVEPDCTNAGATVTTCHQPFRLFVRVDLQLAAAIENNLSVNPSKYSFILEK